MNSTNIHSRTLTTLITTPSPFGSSSSFDQLNNSPSPSLMRKETVNGQQQQHSSYQLNAMYMNETQQQHPSYLLDQKELNELLNVNVQQLAMAKSLSPKAQHHQPPHHRRKNSDEDVYVEETLLFTLSNLSQTTTSSLSQSQEATSSADKALSAAQAQANHAIDQMLQSVEDLRRRNLLVEVHIYDEGTHLDQENQLLRKMMGTTNHPDNSEGEEEDPDAEIDKLLETFSMSGLSMKNTITNGEFIENDIRLNENIREAIDEIKTVQRPANNKILENEKKRFIQRYMDIAEMLGVSLTVEHLLPALQDIFKQDLGGNSDKGYIKLIFASMDKLINFLSSSEITVGYNGIRDFILPFFSDFFQSDALDDTLRQDMQPEVIDLLVKVTKTMTGEDRTEKVLPIILECIRDDAEEEKRILGLELVDKLAEDLGRDVCQNFLMYEIVSLQDDPIYRVRKETVMRMINISKVLGKEIFLGILFPVYKKLANDQIWGVRRAAVEILPQISNLCPPEIKNGILIEIFKKFSQDSSKWVKMATFMFLGPFIASYEGIEPNPLLIDYYINMCEQNKSTAPDNEVPYYCAFNFPAVLYTLGPKSWAKLQPVHDQLVKDSRPKVRRTLAFSLHEIAKILGSDLTEKDLIPVLYHFLKDVNEVKEGVTVNLPKFIQVLSPEQRESYVDKIAQTQIDTQDWRKRIIQAKQIKSLCKIFSSETVYKYYVPVFFELCQDQVAEVRIESSKCIKNIALSLSQSPDYLDDFFKKVILFKESNKFFLRQTFIFMCSSMLKNQELFETYLLQDLIQMQNDRIVNVRIVLSECLAIHYRTHDQGGLVQSCRSLRKLVFNLRKDVEYVSQPLDEVDIEPLSEESQEEMIKQESLIENQSQESLSKEQQSSLNAQILNTENTNTTQEEVETFVELVPEETKEVQEEQVVEEVAQVKESDEDVQQTVAEVLPESSGQQVQEQEQEQKVSLEESKEQISLESAQNSDDIQTPADTQIQEPEQEETSIEVETHQESFGQEQIEDEEQTLLSEILNDLINKVVDLQTQCV